MPLEQKTREIMFVEVLREGEDRPFYDYKLLLSRTIGIVLKRFWGFWLAIADDSIKTSFLIDKIKKAEKAAFSNSRCGNSVRNAIQTRKRKTEKNVCFLFFFVCCNPSLYRRESHLSKEKMRGSLRAVFLNTLAVSEYSGFLHLHSPRLLSS